MTRPMTAITALFMSLCLLSCGEQEASDDWKQCREYDRMSMENTCLEGAEFHEVSFSQGDKTLCETIERGHDNVGVYRVMSIESCPGDEPGYTYVGLELEDAWTTGSRELIRAKFAWGAVSADTCTYDDSDPDLSVDDRVVVFLGERQENEEWTSGLDQDHYFEQREAGGWYDDGGTYAADDLESFRERVMDIGLDPSATDFCSSSESGQ